MDNTPNEGLVMVILCDGSKPTPLSTVRDGVTEMVSFYIDQNGFPVYLTTKKHAGMLCTVKPEKYKLYRSVSLTVQVTEANGAIVWKTVSPWYYEAQNVQVGNDKENDEAIFEKRFVWHEDIGEKHVVSPSKEFITGKAEAPKVDNSTSKVTEDSVLKALRERNEKLAEKIKSLEDDKVNLKGVIAEKNKELASLYEKDKALDSEKKDSREEEKPASKTVSGLDGRYPKKKK